MKKLILIAAAVTVAVSTRAQNGQPAVAQRDAAVRHHEFFAGTGIYAMPNLSAIPEQFVALITFGAVPLESNLRFKPSVAAGYKYRFERVVSLGATFSYSGNTADSEQIWKGETTHLNRDYYALATEVELRWLTREHVTLYSMVGLGAAHKHTVLTAADTGNSDTIRKTIFTAQTSGIGVKAGWHRFGGYFEFGFGYKGVVNFGTYARF